MTRAWLEHVGLAQGLFAAAVVGFVAFVLPYVLRRVWNTHPVPEGPARRLLELVGARAGFRPAEWLVWRTGGAMANAAVVGFTPWGRLVLFTDELLAQLGPRELVAVVGHEIGHTQRRHVWILLAWALAIVLGTDLALTVALERLVGETGGGDEGLVLGLALAAALLAAGAAGFGWLSRRLELDADLYCAELTGDGAALASALRQVDGNWERGGWRHFSSARRVEFLAETVASPARARRFKRFITTLGLVGGLGASLAVAAELHFLAGRVPVERIDAALALGRFEETARLAAALAPGDLDPEEQRELALVVAAGRSLGEGATPEAARAALVRELGVFAEAWPAGADQAAAPSEAAHGALDRAFALAFVATLRGGPDLAPLMEVLRAARRGDVAGVEAGLEALAPELREDLGDPLARATARARATLSE